MQSQKFLVVSLDEVRDAVTKHYVSTHSNKEMVEKVVKGEAKIPSINSLNNNDLLQLAWENDLFEKAGRARKVKAVVVELPEKYYLVWKAKDAVVVAKEEVKHCWSLHHQYNEY